MRGLDYKAEYEKILTPEIVAYIGQIHELKAEQNIFLVSHSGEAEQLLELAKIHSTEASNLIEGIVTTKDRLRKLVFDKTTPKTRDEREIAGYRDVLATIHDNHDYIPLTPNMVLQLHGDLYKFSQSPMGGRFKDSNNLIAEELADGTRRVRFKPVSAWETAEAMQALCIAYDEAIRNEEVDPLTLIPMFVLDFLCIHPFNDGNGRMSRLLTLLLLYRSGYVVGKYVSIEKLIADTKETYYEALYDSSVGWHEQENDYGPFVRYMLGVILAAYRYFASQRTLLGDSGLSKPDRVRRMIQGYIGKITKADLMAQFPDISQKTIERALKDLLDSGDIVKVSSGRYAAYVWNWDKE